jgi:hypothetical protein
LHREKVEMTSRFGMTGAEGRLQQLLCVVLLVEEPKGMEPKGMGSLLFHI